MLDLIRQLGDIRVAVSASPFTLPSCLHDRFLDISANHSVPLNLMQKEFYCLDEFNGLCGNLGISLKGLGKKAQLIMRLKHNTQQTLTGDSAYRTACAPGDVRPRLPQQKVLESLTLPWGRGGDGASCFT